MKIKHLLAVAALCLFSSHASAQSTDWNGIYFQYNPSWISNLNRFLEFDKGSNYVHGFTLGYVKSIPIAGNNIPLFLEVGGNFQYGFNRNSESETVTIGNVKETGKLSETIHMLSLNVPVNFGYSIGLGNGLALNPYVGLRVRLNLVGVDVLKATEEVGDNKQTESETINLYSSSDENMGSSEYTWNRFQIGMQFGAKLLISEKMFVEAGYGFDFNRIGKLGNHNFRTMSVNLGFGYMF